MVITIKSNADKKQFENLLNWIESVGLQINLSEGENYTVVGLVGDTSLVDISLLRSLDIVDSIVRIQEPYKSANRKFHPEDSIIDVGGHKFGGNHFQIIAGPCSIESYDQVLAIAKAVKQAGATILRGGAF